jgi:Transposase domain (DUF772)
LRRRSLIPLSLKQEIRPVMGERRVMQEALFYGFSLERHDHLLRKIDRFVDLSEVRARLGPYYSDVGRPSIVPELMIRMLIVGYGLGIRSERRLCEEVHLNLAYRWFCRLGLDGGVTLHDFFSGLCSQRSFFRPSGPRIISMVDESYGSAPQNEAGALSFEVMANDPEGCLAFSILFVGPRVTNSSPDHLSAAA